MQKTLVALLLVSVVAVTLVPETEAVFGSVWRRVKNIANRTYAAAKKSADDAAKLSVKAAEEFNRKKARLTESVKQIGQGLVDVAENAKEAAEDAAKAAAQAVNDVKNANEAAARQSADLAIRAGEAAARVGEVAVDQANEVSHNLLRKLKNYSKKAGQETVKAGGKAIDTGNEILRRLRS